MLKHGNELDDLIEAQSRACLPHSGVIRNGKIPYGTRQLAKQPGKTAAGGTGTEKTAETQKEAEVTMKKRIGIGVLLLLMAGLIWMETCENGSIVGEDTLLLSSGYYERCDCGLSVKDRGLVRGIVRDRFTTYLLFDVKQDIEHVYVAGMGRGALYHIARRVETPAK